MLQNDPEQPEEPVAVADLPEYFRPVIEAQVQPINLGRMNVVCPECGALHWKVEALAKSRVNDLRFGTCCLDGKIVLPAVRAPPRDLLELFNGTSHRSEHFKKNIRTYNAAFALASLGVTVDKTVLDGHGPYVFKIQGALYHKVGALLPEPGKNPVYAQLYFYSSAEANAACMRRNRATNNMAGLNPEVMGILDAVLQQNAHVRAFKTAFERLRDQQAAHPNVPSEICATIQSEEVAVILPGDGSTAPDYRDIVVQYRNGPTAMKRITEFSPSYQPMVYVLLFPHGEDYLRLQQQA
ncbi:hypothetical protein C8R44DRAFT_724281 [Mycena epipterygia]|nr:hypothetical protein C8R44DRAFT_724281 [Mycena epipterygia]